MRLLSVIMVVFAFVSSISFYPRNGTRKQKIVWGVAAFLVTALLAAFAEFAVRQDEKLEMQVFDDSKTFMGIEIDANGSRFIFQ